MKTARKLQQISIVFYVFIQLKGSMIGLPFLLYLLFNLPFTGSLLQFSTALLAISGLILWIRMIYNPQYELNRNKKLEVFIFILLIAPLIERLQSVSFQQFNYPSFLFPVISFCIVYLLSIIWSNKTDKLIHRISESFRGL